MRPGIRNIKLYAGATDRLTFRVKDKVSQLPIDLTGTSVSSSVTVGSKTYNLQSITVTPLEGKILLLFTPQSKADMLGKGTWGTKIVWPNGDIWRLLEGNVKVIAEK